MKSYKHLAATQARHISISVHVCLQAGMKNSGKTVEATVYEHI